MGKFNKRSWEISDQKDEIIRLRKENAYLKDILRSNGIPLQTREADSHFALHLEIHPFTSSSVLSPDEKITLFRKLFVGRSDVFALRWQSKAGRTGYSPACENEWKHGICRKPGIKCSKCDRRKLLPLTDDVIYNHLAGKHTVGVFPILIDNTCRWLALDFDRYEWRKDALSFLESCRKFDVPASMEISRSGNSAHVWIFFSEPVPSHEARELGTVLISYTCSTTRHLSFTSYDKMFPCRDTLPQDGLGSHIPLPLQKNPRREGHTVFVDSEFIPFFDQWELLGKIQRMSRFEVLSAIENSGYSINSLDVPFMHEKSFSTLEVCFTPGKKIDEEMPLSVTVVNANQIQIGKRGIKPALLNRIIRIAAFRNPEFYKTQAMRLPVWNKPRVICCAENGRKHIGLPRGCMDSFLDLMKINQVTVTIKDKRCFGTFLDVQFSGKLHKNQKVAVAAMLRKDIGVLSAPTAFGKTVTAAAIIARRKVSTIVLVHRTALLDQWKFSLSKFLNITEDRIGVYGSGKKELSGTLDIAIIQAVSQVNSPGQLLQSYGQVIVDECHHVSAHSFENVLKTARAKYVIGLTATPTRRDGQQPIVFMQCGSIVHMIPEKGVQSLRQEVWSLVIPPPGVSSDASIQDVFRAVVNDVSRNQIIANDVIAAYRQGRTILVLTERTAHLKILESLFSSEIKDLFVLHGKISKGRRAAILSGIASIDPTIPHVVLATGRYIGEGFDHPELDTLVLAMPISWKGTLQQYAGRLHRTGNSKSCVRIYDYIEKQNPKLFRMWKHRSSGYKSIGYTIFPRELPAEGQLF